MRLEELAPLPAPQSLVPSVGEGLSLVWFRWGVRGLAPKAGCCWGFTPSASLVMSLQFERIYTEGNLFQNALLWPVLLKGSALFKGGAPVEPAPHPSPREDRPLF